MTKSLPPPKSLVRHASIGAGVGAGIGLVLWLFSGGHGTIQFGPFRFSDAWIKSVPWPLPGWFMVPLIIATIGAVVGVVAEIRRRRRMEQMALVAAQMQLKHEPTASGDFTFIAAQVFKDTLTIVDRFHGQRGDLRFDIVDVTETSESQGGESGSRESHTRRTVCLLPAGGLPEFTLAPRSASRRALQLLKLGGLSFDAQALESPQDRQTVRNFASAWHLTVRDPLRLSDIAPEEIAELEQRTRGLFTTRVMEALRRHTGWSVEVRAERMLVWRGTGFAAPRQRPRLAEAAIALRGIFLAALEAPQGLMVPGIPGAQLEHQTKRGIAAAVGGGLGILLGFFSGAMVHLSFFFGRHDEFSHGASTFFFIALPLGGAVLGGAVGALVGSRLGAWVKLPFPPRKAPARPPSVWASLIPFLGFALGGATGMGSIILWTLFVGHDVLPFWCLAIFFFACPIAGLIGGTILANRLRGN